MSDATAARTLKVVRVIARLNIGGPARHVVLLDQGLRARGYDTLLVHGSVGPGEASLEHLAAAGLRASKIPELGPRLSAAGDLKAFVDLVRITFREAPDVIHTHTAKAGALGRLTALLYNATRRRNRRALVVHTFHGHVLSGYFGTVGSGLVRAAERCLALVTDRIVTLSASQRRDIVERFRVASGSRVVTIPLGLDLEALLRTGPDAVNLRQSLAIGADDLVIGFVGRFVPVKNLRLLVDAFRSVLREVPAAWLMLAGDGPSRADVEEAARQAGILDRVRLLGWTEDLPSVYATMDICALTSINEGTPVAVVEAMAAGRAVVATSVGGVPDLIEHGRTGQLVPSGDAAAFAAALVRLARAPATRRELGTAARHAVEQRFSPLRLASDIDQLYRAGLASKRR